MRGRMLIAVLLAGLAGCGYGFSGEQRGLDPSVHTLSVGAITNRSGEYGLEKRLQFAIEREVRVRHQLQIDENPGGGDAVLTGTIRDVRVRPVAFDSNDRAVQYQLTMILDFTLSRPSDGRVLWHVSGLRQIDEYAASANVVVTSSSQFQRGTLDATDINNPEFSSIQLAESDRKLALTRLLTQTARDVYDQMLENF
jgi:hypothetical protein